MNELTNVLLIVVGVLVGALQAFVLLILKGIREDIQAVKKDVWEEIQQVKREHWEEIVRLRDKYHELKPMDGTLKNFTVLMEQVLGKR